MIWGIALNIPTDWPKRSVTGIYGSYVENGIAAKATLLRLKQCAPACEVPMDFIFADILDKEMKAQGVSSSALPRPALPALPAPATGIQSSSRPSAQSAPAVTLNFSSEAERLSCSLRHYADDSTRPCKRDSGILSGWSEAGYILKVEGGLTGEMCFSTESGAKVLISAGTPQNEPSLDVRISVVKEGVEFHFGIDDVAAAVSGPAPVAAGLLALQSADEAGPEEDAVTLAPAAITYSPRGAARVVGVIGQEAERFSENFAGHV